MRARSIFTAAAVALFLCVGAMALSLAKPRAALSGHAALPSLVLWAWERPVELPDLGPGIAVAFLAQSIDLRVDGYDVDSRRQPLVVSPATPLIAVTRIESRQAPPASERAAVDAIADLVVATARLPRVAGLQIDFDATATQRPFYRALIRRVRTLADPAVPVSMTALASWCAGDSWLGDVEVDEVVPMLFRMGEMRHLFEGLAASADRARPRCGAALGTSLDEPYAIVPGGRRIYVFNPNLWTPAAVAAARRLAGQS
jgi:hypothetical protein